MSPSLDALNAALHDLAARHSKAALEGFLTTTNAATAVLECTTRVLASPGPNGIEALDGIIRAYAQTVGPELSTYEEQVTTACNCLRAQPSNASAVAAIAKAVHNWHSLGASMIALEAYKDRDHERASTLCYQLRSLAVDLANDHHQYDLALSLTKVALDSFSALPRAASQLKEDIPILESRVTEAGVEPLRKWINVLGDDHLVLVEDLQRYGFCREATEDTKELFDCFSRSVQATQSTKASDLPWILVRGIALAINNNENAPRAALALTIGLLRHAEGRSVSIEVLDQLREDRRTIERNILQDEMSTHIKANRVSEALAIVSKLLSDFTSPEERNLLRGVQAKLQSRRTGQRVRWAFFGLIGAGILIAVLTDNSSSPPGYTRRTPQPSPTYPLPPIQGTFGSSPVVTPPTTHSTAELIPEPGAGRDFSQGNIRYCLYQEVRLDAVRTSLSTNQDIDAFNTLISDWNSRCANYRYLESDMSAVRLEVTQKEASLEEDGRKIVAAWRQQIVPTIQPPYAPPTPYVPSAPRPYTPSISASTETVPLSPPKASPDQQVTLALDLLRTDDATRVQKRLAELGYFQGPPNGTWGPQSRGALYLFKLSNGLGSDDLFDSATANQLFSTSVIRSGAGTKSSGAQPTFETNYAAPYGATLNPLNRSDATRIHSKLRALGFYKGKNDSIWSGASRVALRDFKKKYGLSQDDVWDASTEQKLLSVAPDRPAGSVQDAFATTVAGTWVTDIRACPRGSGGTDAPPILITATRAEGGGGACSFGDVNGSGSNWTLKAVCSFNGNTWTANVNLIRAGDLLTWSSERGVVKYRRCGD